MLNDQETLFYQPAQAHKVSSMTIHIISYFTRHSFLHQQQILARDVYNAKEKK